MHRRAHRCRRRRAWSSACAIPTRGPADGAKRLREAGIQVEFAEDPEPFAALNEGWLKRIAIGHPVRHGEARALARRPRRLSQRASAPSITGASGAEVTRLLRSAADAVLVSAATVIADDPALTVRDADGAPRRSPAAASRARARDASAADAARLHRRARRDQACSSRAPALRRWASRSRAHEVHRTGGSGLGDALAGAGRAGPRRGAARARSAALHRRVGSRGARPARDGDRRWMCGSRGARHLFTGAPDRDGDALVAPHAAASKRVSSETCRHRVAPFGVAARVAERGKGADVHRTDRDAGNRHPRRAGDRRCAAPGLRAGVRPRHGAW